LGQPEWGPHAENRFVYALVPLETMLDYKTWLSKNSGDGHVDMEFEKYPEKPFRKQAHNDIVV